MDFSDIRTIIIGEAGEYGKRLVRYLEIHLSSAVRVYHFTTAEGMVSFKEEAEIYLLDERFFKELSKEKQKFLKQKKLILLTWREEQGSFCKYDNPQKLLDMLSDFTDYNSDLSDLAAELKDTPTKLTIVYSPVYDEYLEQIARSFMSLGDVYMGAEDLGYKGIDSEYGEGGDMGDIFENFFGGGFKKYGFRGGSGQNGNFNNGFHGNFRQNEGFGNRQSYQTKGNDIHADIQVSFDAAAFGKKETIHLKDENGKVQALEVNIPAGIETGQSIRLKGKGTPGYNGGTAGDLFLKVTVSEKPGFKRDNQDISNTVTIPFITAVLGGDVTVPTIYGNVRCSIKPGTQSGSKLRLRGKGIVSMKNSSVHGDQYTTIEVQVPKNLSPKAKQKLMEFAAEL